jgi:hypothetical protein
MQNVRSGSRFTFALGYAAIFCKYPREGYVSVYSHSMLPCMTNVNYESSSTGRYTWTGLSVGDCGFEKGVFDVIIIV